MNKLEKVFFLAGGVLVVLLLMYNLPPLKIGGIEFRRVNMLSDLMPDSSSSRDVFAAPPVPKPKTEKPRGTYKPYNPPGVELIADYSDGKPGGMNRFYELLLTANKIDHPIRIAYYSDSFVEGDVMLADLREMFQRDFGGNGVGWVDCVKGFNVDWPTISVTSSGFTNHMVTDKSFAMQREGINQKFFTATSGATLSLHALSHNKGKGTKQWTASRLFFTTPSSVSISANGAPAKSFKASPNVQHFDVDGPQQSLKLRLASVGAGTIFYGVALESQRGVILDNLGIRGIPGLSLADMPQAIMQQFAAVRPYDLIVIHFGINAADDRNTKDFYEFYHDRIGQAVQKFRQAFPDAAILIMGITDSDKRYPDGIHTKKAVKHMNEYQNLIAADNHVAYFNLFKAMGGDDSMKGFVEKRMASKDYTHVDYHGGRIIAGHIYDAFKAGLENYKRKKAAGLIK